MRKPIPYIEILRKLCRAGVQNSPPINRRTGDFSDMQTLQERVDFLLGVVNKPARPATNMLFFVMYDIESDKVRYHIAKYLERKGYNDPSFLPTSTRPFMTKSRMILPKYSHYTTIMTASSYVPSPLISCKL